jgi:hypothetical protein
MTNDESQMTKEGRNPKPEGRRKSEIRNPKVENLTSCALWGLGFVMLLYM